MLSLCDNHQAEMIYIERGYIYIYIYIYIYKTHVCVLHSTVCYPGFHAISNCRTEWRSLKKVVNMVNFCLKSGGGVFVCVCLWILVCLCMFCHSRTHMCVCLYLYRHSSLHVYIYFRCLLVWRRGTKEESVRRKEWVREGEGNWLLKSDFIVLYIYRVER